MPYPTPVARKKTVDADTLEGLSEVISIVTLDEGEPWPPPGVFAAAAGEEVVKSLTLNKGMRLRAQPYVDVRFPFLQVKSGWLDPETCALYVGGSIGHIPGWFTVILTQAEVDDILEGYPN